MAKKPTYEELEQRVRELENEKYEHRRTEKALRESEERFRIAGKAAYDLIYEWIVVGDSLEWFGDIDGLLGYEPGTISRDINTWLELIHPEDRDQLENAVELHRTEKDPIRYDYRIKHRDGTYRQIHDHGLPILDKQGRPYKWIGACVDITERRRAEEALKENEFYFSQMFEQSTTSMCFYNPDGTINRVNNEFCEMFGVEEKVIINSVYNVFKDQAAINAGIIPLLEEIFHEKKTKHWETNFDIDVATVSTGIPTSKTGKVFLEVFGYPVLNNHGDLEYVVLQHYDITERKRAEEALRESEEQYKSLVESTDDSIYLLDKEGIYRFVNEKHLSRLGCIGKEKVIGKTYGDFHSLKDTKIFLEKIGEVYKTGETTQHEHKSPRDDRYFLRTLSPVKNSEGYTTSVTVVSKEISERKQAEEALRESEKRFRYLADASMEAIFFTQQGICLEANQIAAEMFGYDDRSEFIGMFGTEIIAPESHEIVKEHMLKNILEPYEAIGERKDGTRFPIAIRAKEMPYKDKEMVRVTSIMDITELKRAEQAIKTAETTYRNIFRNSQIGLFRSDMNTGLLLDANDAVAQFIGYKDRDELLAEPFNIAERYVDPKDRDEIVSLLKAHGEFRNYEARYRRNDGAIMWMRFSAKIVPEKGWMEGVSEDITDRKLAEVSRLESEERFSKLFFNSPTWVSISRLEDGTFLEVNKAFEDMTGFDRKVVIGRTSLELGLWHEPGERKRILRLANEKGGFREEEVTFIAKNGDPLTALWSADVIDVGDETCLISTVMDITRLRKAEMEKEMLQAQLHRSQKMEALGTLAGGVAHDLNNILGGIVSYPELLLMQLPLDSPIRKPIQTIRKSGEKAAAVVQDLLTLARRGVVVNEVVNLNDVIAEYLKSPEHEKLQLDYPGVRIESYFEKDIFNILGSPTHLSKAVMNMIYNAAEAMPEGGELSVSTENKYLDRPIKSYDDVKEGDYVVLTVSDAGTGISPNDIEKIFEPFYTKKKMGKSGTGLGMAVVWGTVKDHNGYVDVLSIEGKGTTFTLYFPVTRKKMSGDKSYLAIESYCGSGESILIVDDVEEQREIASDMLNVLGYSVRSVSSGEEAVEYLKRHEVDLLVLDMIMDPGMDGFDTYKRILEIRPGQKAIIGSGFSETPLVKELKKLGAGSYVKKPFLLEKLGLAVKEELVKSADSGLGLTT